MAKKIEGYGLEEGNYWQEGKPIGSKANWQEATLIIGEKAFTESEVRAMLSKAGLLNQIGQSVDKGIYSQRLIKDVFGAAGIVLDSA